MSPPEKFVIIFFAILLFYGISILPDLYLVNSIFVIWNYNLRVYSFAEKDMFIEMVFAVSVSLKMGNK